MTAASGSYSRTFFLCIAGCFTFAATGGAHASTLEECNDKFQEAMEVINDPFAYKPSNAAQQAQASLDQCRAHAASTLQRKPKPPDARNPKQPHVSPAQSALIGSPELVETGDPGHSGFGDHGGPTPRPLSSLKTSTKGPQRHDSKHRTLVRASGLMTGTSQRLDREAARKIYEELDPNDPALLTLAEQGEPYALEFIGSALIRGEGIARDLPRGEAMLRKSANRGNIMAMFNLGVLSLYGKGSNGTVDNAQAARWLNLAADKGHAEAQTVYGAMLWSGTGIQKDRPAALPYFERAAAKGDGEANYNLGIVFSTGADGNRASFLKAIKHLEVAERGQHDKASALLQQLRQKAADNVAMAMAASGMAPIRTSSDFKSYFGACGSSTEVVKGLPPALRDAALVCVSKDSARCGIDLGVPSCGAAHFGFDKAGNTLWGMLSITGKGTDSRMVESFRKRFGAREPVSRQQGGYLHSHFAWSEVGYKVEVDAFYPISNRESIDPFAVAWASVD